MPRFSLMQLLMGTTLIAQLLVLTQTESCGARYSKIETLSFSTDGTRILVTKLTARDAQTPLKRYKADVARTISWLDSASGIGIGVIHQDFIPGNSGPAFHYWRAGRTSVICNPSNDRIAFCAFGGGDITYGASHAKPRTISLAQPATNLAISPSGRLLAASGMNLLTIVDTTTYKTILQTSTDSLPFLGALLMAFNRDESRLITAGYSRLHVWDTIKAKQIATLPMDPKSSINGIAVMPDDTLVVCSDTCIERYDLSGKLLNTIDNHGGNGCVAAASTNKLVVFNGDTLTLRDVNDGNIERSLPISDVVSLALSLDAKMLAVGDYDGCVALYNLADGERQWIANPPGRHRWPWTIPVALIVAWFWIAYRLTLRAPRANPNRGTFS